MLESFVPLVRQLLNERNHGVLLTGVTLTIEMCQMDAETLDYFRRVWLLGVWLKIDYF